MPRYLPGFAEPEARRAAELPLEGSFGHVVVIPACGEGPGLERAIDSVPPGPLGIVLVLVVINARDDHPEPVHAANALSLSRLGARPAEPRHRQLLVIDRASPGRRFPPKQGVGLARKLGHDVALALRAAGRVSSRFQHATDADACLPGDYFARIEALEAGPTAPAGLVYPWRHLPDPDSAAAEAIVLYDIWLRYHHLALNRAGSPFAYPSIGSTLAVSHDAYEVVRGFPKRQAGEDFYLLDKLAKTGAILRLGGQPILLEGRPSDRVPFGTGRSVREMTTRGETAATYKLLDPRTYDLLASWLAFLAAPPATPADLPAELDRRAEAGGLNGRERAGLRLALERMGAFTGLAATLALGLDSLNRRRRVHTGFDAFETLKLLHQLRDGGWPPLPLREALARAEFGATISSLSAAGPPAALAEALQQLEEQQCRTPVGVLMPCK